MVPFERIEYPKPSRIHLCADVRGSAIAKDRIRPLPTAIEACESQLSTMLVTSFETACYLVLSNTSCDSNSMSL